MNHASRLTASRLCSLAFCLTSFLLVSQTATAQTPVPPKDPAWLLPAADIDVDPKMPTLTQVVGHRWGQEISSHAEIERSGSALAST